MLTEVENAPPGLCRGRDAMAHEVVHSEVENASARRSNPCMRVPSAGRGVPRQKILVGRVRISVRRTWAPWRRAQFPHSTQRRGAREYVCAKRVEIRIMQRLNPPSPFRMERS